MRGTNVNIRCEICGRIYDENGAKGRVTVNEIKPCDCGSHNEGRYLSANTCPECVGKVLDFVDKLIHGDK